MTIDDKYLERIKLNVLRYLECNGIEPDRVLLGLRGDEDEGGMYYETHVGATQDSKVAVDMDYIAKEIRREADGQTMKLLDREVVCPQCSSKRCGCEQRFPEPYRVELWDVCMDCDYERKRDR